ncbi:MAG: MFS transporter [Pseudomonadota bacterium]
MDLSFYRRNAWWLGTGFLLMFTSSFGQTYFIALFAGGIREEFGLSNGEWGGIYTLATLGSAALLVFAGRLTDTMPLKTIATIILAAYACAAATMALAPHVAVLVIAIFGLRFCGQGMTVQISSTAIARWFAANRGRAVAISVLGFPIGEALFPVLAVNAQEVLGWRGTWLLVAALLLLVLLPAAFFLLRHGRVPQGEGGGDDAVGMGGRHWTRREVLSHWSFYAVFPGIIAAPFIGTCLFFHQVHISEVRGFDLSTMALAFPLYASISVTTSLITGNLVDRFGPQRLLPFFLIPLGCAVFSLSLPGDVWLWFAVLALTGLGQGIAITMMSALWPTLYGTRAIGSIKSIFSATMVFATAAGPGVTGLIIDEGIDFPSQGIVFALYCFAMSALFAVLAPRLSAELPRRVDQPV